jgi:hypothetical protein
MAAVVLTATHKVIGTLPNGHKIVLTTATPNTGEDIGSMTITPLTRVVNWSFSVKDPGTIPNTYIAVLGTDSAPTSGMNRIYIDPVSAASPAGAVFEVLSIGY